MLFVMRLLWFLVWRFVEVEMFRLLDSGEVGCCELGNGQVVWILEEYLMVYSLL